MKAIVPIKSKTSQRRGIDMIQRIVFATIMLNAVACDPDLYGYPNQNRGRVGREYKVMSLGRFARMRS